MSGQCPEKDEFCRKETPRSSRPKSSGVGLQIDRGRCLPPLGSYSLAFLKADKSNARPTVAASGCLTFQQEHSWLGLLDGSQKPFASEVRFESGPAGSSHP